MDEIFIKLFTALLRNKLTNLWWENTHTHTHTHYLNVVYGISTLSHLKVQWCRLSYIIPRSMIYKPMYVCEVLYTCSVRVRGIKNRKRAVDDGLESRAHKMALGLVTASRSARHGRHHRGGGTCRVFTGARQRRPGLEKLCSQPDSAAHVQLPLLLPAEAHGVCRSPGL